MQLPWHNIEEGKKKMKIPKTTLRQLTFGEYPTECKALKIVLMVFVFIVFWLFSGKSE